MEDIDIAPPPSPPLPSEEPEIIILSNNNNASSIPPPLETVSNGGNILQSLNTFSFGNNRKKRRIITNIRPRKKAKIKLRSKQGFVLKHNWGSSDGFDAELGDYREKAKEKTVEERREYLRKWYGWNQLFDFCSYFKLHRIFGEDYGHNKENMIYELSYYE